MLESEPGGSSVGSIEMHIGIVPSQTSLRKAEVDCAADEEGNEVCIEACEAAVEGKPPPYGEEGRRDDAGLTGPKVPCPSNGVVAAEPGASDAAAEKVNCIEEEG